MNYIQLKQDLVAELPDSIVKAVGDARAAATNSNDYHIGIKAARDQLGLPPWHPMTLLAKVEGRTLLKGRNYASENLWITKQLERSTYYPEFQAGHENDWVTFDFVMEVNGERSNPIRLSVHPEKELIWNQETESVITTKLLIYIKGGKHSTTAHHIIQEAEKILYGDSDLEGIPLVVSTYETPKRRALKQLEETVVKEEKHMEVVSSDMAKAQETVPEQDATKQVATKQLTPVIEVARQGYVISEKDELLMNIALDLVKDASQKSPSFLKELTALFQRLKGPREEAIPNEG